MYLSDESWPRLKEGEVRRESISYLSIFHYINKPTMLTDFDRMGIGGIIYYVLSIPGCIFLFLLVGKHATNQTLKTRRDQSMFCENCGTKLQEDAVFCSNCGAKIQKSQPTATISNDQHVIQNTVSSNLVGFSDRCNHPEILAAAKSNRRSAMGCMWVLVFVPLIGFPIAGMLMDDFPFGESVIIGVGIAVIMLIVNILGLRRSKKPMWEGVVVNKYSKEKQRHNRTNDESDTYTTYTEYNTVIQINTGKKKTIVERDSQRDMYDYLSVGDRVRYHPTFGTYEKYDKSKDRMIYCNVCMMMNPIGNDRCKRCNNLLFK